MEWRGLFKSNILNGAQDYITSGSVKNYEDKNGHISAVIEGIENFSVAIDYDENIKSMTCSCPYAMAGNNCKHMAAALLQWESLSSVDDKAASDNRVDNQEQILNPVETSEPVAPTANQNTSTEEPQDSHTADDNDSKPARVDVYIAIKPRNQVALILDGETEITIDDLANRRALVFGYLYINNESGKVQKNFGLKFNFGSDLLQADEIALADIEADEKIRVELPGAGFALTSYMDVARTRKSKLDVTLLINDKDIVTETTTVTIKPAPKEALEEILKEIAFEQEIVKPGPVELFLSIDEDKGVTFNGIHNPRIIYAMYANKQEMLIGGLNVVNEGGTDISDVSLDVSFDTDLLEPMHADLGIIPKDLDGFRDIEDPKVNAAKLTEITETLNCHMTIKVSFGDEFSMSVEKDVEIFPYDQWDGEYIHLPAYIMPNHPAITKLMHDATDWLKKNNLIQALEGYQGDANRVKEQAAALYAAIQKANISYANPPASFEIAQRIRLCDTVLEKHFGTCMDMTLLYVSCLEAVNINPILITAPGHIFVGVWMLEGKSLKKPEVYDSNYIKTLIETGEIMPVECTAMNAGKSLRFDEAVDIAKQAVKRMAVSNINCSTVDVHSVRRMGLIPMPMRVKGADGKFDIKVDELSMKELTSAPSKADEIYEYDDHIIKEDKGKISYWEHKLLDTSSRNKLVNFKMAETLPLFAPVAELEDYLADGNEFSIDPISDVSIPLADIQGLLVERTLTISEEDKGHIREALQSKRVLAPYEIKKLNTFLRKLYRTTADGLEETGASTLYMVLGLLKWYDTTVLTAPSEIFDDEKLEKKKRKKTKKEVELKPMYAPLILLPVDIYRKSAGNYSLRMRDEAPRFNLTLLEMLNQKFSVVINDVDPLPRDEHGLDTKRIFNAVRHATIEQEGWSVIESAFLGNFTFGEFVMWNDMHSHEDELVKNKIVKSLVEGALTFDAKIPDSVDEDDVFLPMPADGSQLHAIKMAANDVSFVLHGPPGTGKSQTITALIANALTKGKTVLFVAEKQTALEVVARRLKSLGIGAFCLELHSNKTNAREVLCQLEEPLNIDKHGSEKSYEEKLAEAMNLRKELDAYGNLIHKKLNSGFCLRELIDLYEEMGDVDCISFDKAYTDTLDPKVIAHHKRILEQLIAYGSGVGRNRIADFMPIRITHYSQSMRTGLKAAVNEYQSVLSDYRTIAASVVNALNLDMPKSKEEWDILIARLQSKAKVELCPEDVDTIDEVETASKMAKAYLEKNAFAKEKMLVALAVWKKEFLSLNMDPYLAELNEANSKLFKGKYLKTLQDKLIPFANGPVNMNAVASQMQIVKEYQKASQEVKSSFDAITYSFRTQLAEEFTESDIEKLKDRMISAVKAADEAVKQNTIPQDLLDSAAPAIAELLAAKDKLDIAYNELTDMLSLNTSSFTDNWIDSQIEFCDKLLANADYIKEWISYYQARTEGMTEGLAPAIKAYEAGADASTLIRAYEKGVYQTLIYSTIDSEPVLNAFNGSTFAEKIAYFKKVDADLVQLAKDVTFYRLAQNLPSVMDGIEVGKEINLLRKAITGNQKIYIRSLFDQIPHILHRLCPCILMSPMSVSQYIPLDSEQFDLVVFDEASQIPTHKAIGALARAKNAVIVGDPKQMPPTDFFGTSAEEGTLTADELKKTDLDSVLEDCLALGLPSAYLKWHYRSRHESLIQFSNANFYGNTMLTFPSVNDRESKVHMHYLVGDYSKGTNRIEAREIVKEILIRYKDEERKNESIGVVTFNVNQRDLIESLLQKEYERDPGFDVWAHGGVDRDKEDIFIKNLENVQGDERDVILFSITYGPAEDGSVSQNFGPINKPGGDKRLNVAFSRARCEMMIFSSLKAENIIVKNHNPGTQAFHDFLKMAEMGSKPVGEQQEEFVYDDKGIITGICNAITEAGYEVQKHIGHSDFQIDIGVVNPYDPSSYLLGIMLDGDTYAMTKDTKDREVSQIGVLGGLGWTLYRIWTMDWWDSKEKQVNLLLSKLDSLKDAAKIEYEKSLNQTDEAIDVELAEGGEEEYEVYKEMSEQIENEQNEAENESNETAEEVDNLLGLATESIDSEAVSVVKELETSEFEANERHADENIGVKYLTEQIKAYEGSLADMNATSFLEASNVKRLKQLAIDIAELEAPISHEALTRAIFKACNISRGGKQVNEQADKIIAASKLKSTRYNGVKFYWNSTQEPNAYYIYRVGEVRNADDMCKQELSNAVGYILQENGPMTKDEIAREMMKLLGYVKVTSKVTDGTALAIKAAKAMGIIEQDDDKRFRLI